MRKLIREGSLSLQDNLYKYLDFMESIGNYSQVNTVASVMIYDHEFRRKQAERRRPWDSDDFHLANYILQRKEQPTDYRPRGNRQGNSSLSVELCKNFNSYHGCNRDQCRYAHVCMVCKKAGHNSLTHRSNQQLDPRAGSFTPASSNGSYRR